VCKFFVKQFQCKTPFYLLLDWLAFQYEAVIAAFKAGGWGVTKRYRLSWLTNSALIYEPKFGGRGGVAGFPPMSATVHRSPNKLWR
jgi:hypothetical protein